MKKCVERRPMFSWVSTSRADELSCPMVDVGDEMWPEKLSVNSLRGVFLACLLAHWNLLSSLFSIFFQQDIPILLSRWSCPRCRRATISVCFVERVGVSHVLASDREAARASYSSIVESSWRVTPVASLWDWAPGWSPGMFAVCWLHAA